MRMLFSKRNILLAAALALLLALIAFLFSRPPARVTVLNQGFRILTAKISHGTTHKVFFGRWPEGAVREQFHSWGFKVQRFGGLECSTGKDSYVFVLRYTGQFPRNELQGVKAEIVDGSGVATPLQGGGESYSATKNEFARIWVLDPPPTNPATLRLKLATRDIRLAEIGIGACNVR